ncbi:MAG: prolyl oligopeptidase family serine peptidase [Gemmataceae bacterium]|nr:prolyl oligopeptidase family serine peptidase [Gemmataceae bacterium]
MTANLYRPRALNGKRAPAIVYVCGHSGKGRDGNKTAFQDHGFWFANHGYVCIVLDTLQLGEIPGVHHGTYGRSWGHLKSWGLDVPSPPRPVAPSPLLPVGADPNPFRPWWWSAGYTPAGVECWNGIRAIDYLVTRPDVDPDRIGVTGISGGGAATFWIAAADERVKVAVPVSGMSDLEFYVKGKGVNGHCDCMFLYNTHQWDWTTIAALVAPRPMLFANSDNDRIFPMDGNRRIIAKLRDCYKMHGKPDLVDEYVSVGGHDYRPDLRIAIFKFINKHLKGDTTTPVEDSAKYTPLPGKDLRVFPTDADVPKDALNARIDETFAPRAKVALPKDGEFEPWKKSMLKTLRERLKHAAYAAPAMPVKASVRGATSFRTEPGITADVLDGTPLGADANQWAVQTHDKPPPSQRLLPGITVGPRGLLQSWTKQSPPNTIERSHVLLGRTTDEGRLRDVLAIRRHYKKAGHKLDDQTIYAYGDAGVLAAYAVLFEPGVNELILANPPKSHVEGPHFLGILRVIDIPDALGLLAPTPLTIIGGNDPAFDRTAEIYRLAGAADKLTRK